MRNRALALVILSFVIAFGSLAATLVAGNEPLLGLDLQGGISVVLKPTEDVDDGRIEQAVEIIRRRVDSLGVAEPEITTRGQTILVQIPGVDDPERALELVGQTAELRFRPVLRTEPSGPALEDILADTTTTAPPEGSTTTGPSDASTTTSPTDAPTTTAGDGATTTIEAPATTAPATTGTDEVGMLAPGENAGGTPATAPRTDDAGTPVGADEVAQGTPTTAGVSPATVPTTIPAPTTTVPEVGSGVTLPPTTAPLPSGLLADEELTSSADDEAEATVILPQLDDDGTEIARYQLGPAAISGDALSGARAVLDPNTSEWVVIPNFKSGSPGIDDLNAIAAVCFAQGPECPTAQLAIVLDGEVISAPGIQQASFERDAIQISGAFTESEAKDLALVLRYGALPVELEPQAAEVVSATVGEDALRAGVIAGIFGLLLASVYVLVLYRLLGLVAIFSLLLSAAILWAVVAYLGANQGLALTLAGVTGLIVSIGISLDSNIVYFEHLKEDVRNGRTVRSAIDRSFAGAFRTIVAADMVSLIGAAILYWLTIGSVRGFALFLGIATLIDLAATWFFMRPTVILMGRWKWVESHPRALALSPPEDDEPVGSPELVSEPAGVS